MSDTSTGVDINAKAGESLELPCKIQYLVMDKKGEGYCYNSPWEAEAKQWLADELKDRPSGMCKDYHVVEDRWYPSYTADLQQATAVIDEMHNRGFWMRLTSPFKDYEPWFCYFEFHGTWDSHPLWEASSTNPAEAVVLAAIKCIEGNPEVFKPTKGEAAE